MGVEADGCMPRILPLAMILMKAARAQLALGTIPRPNGFALCQGSRRPLLTNWATLHQRASPLPGACPTKYTKLMHRTSTPQRSVLLSVPVRFFLCSVVGWLRLVRESKEKA